eukprot:4263681-Pleurochrysis_carterae.AAC.1
MARTEPPAASAPSIKSKNGCRKLSTEECSLQINAAGLSADEQPHRSIRMTKFQRDEPQL